MTTVNRRAFIESLGAASALTIVPRRVLGGPGFVPPSDQILLAQIGCGTQAQRPAQTASGAPTPPPSPAGGLRTRAVALRKRPSSGGDGVGQTLTVLQG